MKKIKWLFMAIVLAAVSTAFAYASKVDETEYYKDGAGNFHELTPNGFCDTGTEYCKYRLVGGNYEPILSTVNQQWIP